MDSSAFGGAHLPSQALVVLSEAASGLHEALRGQRPFPTRLPDAKDLHNMSLVGSYGSHLLHTFHPHLLQTLNHGMLANGAPASYFASDRGSGGATGKPSVLSNFQLPSAFSPPKYIGISLDQNLFNGSDSFRTDSASPTCTSHESIEGSNDYDAEAKGESPRSNHSDPRDLRHIINKPTTSAKSIVTTTTTHHQQQQQSQLQPQHQPQQQHNHHQQHQHQHHHHHHHHPSASLSAGVGAGAGSGSSSVGCPTIRGVATALGGLSVGGGGLGHLSSGPSGGHVPDLCPVCGLKLTPEEWNSHLATELDRLYKLTAGIDRPSLQASYMFAPPCPAQENSIRSSHNRWETFQRIRNNRQNRLRIKVRKRKYGNEMYFLDNLFCSSCPICKRKYALEGGKIAAEDEVKLLHHHPDEIETVDVESCNDDVPDSGSEQLNRSSTGSSAISSNGSNSSSGSIGISCVGGGSNMHNSSNQLGKLDGILYRTACVINKASIDDDVVTTNTTIGGAPATSCYGLSREMNPASVTTKTAASSSLVASSSAIAAAATTTTATVHGHISVKNVNELSSTTHHFYTADSCGVDDRLDNGKDVDVGVSSDNNYNNDSDEDVIVDDDDTMRFSIINRKRKYEETIVSSRSSENLSPAEERPRSEPQVTSTEPNMELSLNSNNNINNNHNTINNNNNTDHMPNKFQILEDPRPKSLQQHLEMQQQQQLHQTGPDTNSGLTHVDSKVGISSEVLPDKEYKCFICKTGLRDFSSDFFRGRNLYFHQSCANVMSTYRLSKDLLQQQQNEEDLLKASTDSGANANQ